MLVRSSHPGLQNAGLRAQIPFNPPAASVQRSARRVTVRAHGSGPVWIVVSGHHPDRSVAPSVVSASEPARTARRAVTRSGPSRSPGVGTTPPIRATEPQPNWPCSASPRPATRPPRYLRRQRVTLSQQVQTLTMRVRFRSHGQLRAVKATSASAAVPGLISHQPSPSPSAFPSTHAVMSSSARPSSVRELQPDRPAGMRPGGGFHELGVAGQSSETT